MKDLERLLTVADLADCLQLKQSTVRKWVCYGKIPFIKIGAAVRFRPTDIDQWIEARRQVANSLPRPDRTLD